MMAEIKSLKFGSGELEFGGNHDTIVFGAFGTRMAATSNMGFHQGMIPPSAFNRHAVAFQSGAINSSAEMIPVGSSSGMSGGFGIIPGGNSGGINSTTGAIQSGSSSSGVLLESVPGLKHDTGLAVEWSYEEQSKLEEGLVKFADEPNIMKYVKIAATLRDKVVRDVALRCRWMTKKENGKRRKAEEHHYMGKKIKDKKEKLVDSSSNANIPVLPRPNVAPFSFMMQHKDQNTDHISCEALCSTTRHLLDENAQVLSQITANLTMLRMQDSIDLFCRTRNNITTILNKMREMPGIMSQMPPLPVEINEELANAILPGPRQALMYGTPGSIQLKQEPRC